MTTNSASFTSANAESEMGVDRFDVINRIAALIYEPYVRQFVCRDLHEVERITIAALNPPIHLTPHDSTWGNGGLARWVTSVGGIRKSF